MTNVFDSNALIIILHNYFQFHSVDKKTYFDFHLFVKFMRIHFSVGIKLSLYFSLKCHAILLYIPMCEGDITHC